MNAIKDLNLGVGVPNYWSVLRRREDGGPCSLWRGTMVILGAYQRGELTPPQAEDNQ